MIEVTSYAANRKLHIKGSSGAYTTLTALDMLVREGHQIKVTSYPEGEDLTDKVLRSLIVGRARRQAGLLKTPELYQTLASDSQTPPCGLAI